MGWLRRLGRSVVEVDRALVALTGPVRVGVVVVAVLATSLALDRLADAIPAAIGILFAGIADPETADRSRIRVLVWGALWGAAGALVAGLVSDSLPAVLVAAVPVLLVCGFVGAFGARASVVGILVGVVFAIFAGTPTTMTDSVRDALSYLAGGLLMTAVIAVPGALCRFRSSRAALARFLRGIGHVRPGVPASMMAPGHAARVRAFEAAVGADRPEPAVAAWFTGLAVDANEARLGLLAIAIDAVDGVTGEAVDGGRDHSAVDRFVAAATGTARSAARYVVWPLGRAGLARARVRLAGAADALTPATAGDVRQAVERTHRALDRVAAALVEPWPVGRVGRRAPAAGARVPWRRRAAAELRVARGHLRWRDPFTRHAVRLSVTFAVAVVVSHWLDLPHPYWLPMTVAWISKPAQSDTTTKVVARVCGTLVGVLVSALVLEVLQPGDGILIGLVGLAAVLALAYVFANYSLAVTGVTIFVFFLFTLAGEPMGSSFGSRVLATVLAGVLVFVAAVAWPTRSGAGVAATLADFTEALAGYTRAVLAGGSTSADVRALHSVVLETRTAAVADIQSIGFEVGHHRLDPTTAGGVLESLHGCTAHTLIREFTGASDADRSAAEAVDAEFSALRDRLRILHTDGVVPARQHPADADHPVHRWVRRAHTTLDGAAGPEHRHHHRHVHDRLV